MLLLLCSSFSAFHSVICCCLCPSSLPEARVLFPKVLTWFASRSLSTASLSHQIQTDDCYNSKDRDLPVIHLPDLSPPSHSLTRVCCIRCPNKSNQNSQQKSSNSSWLSLTSFCGPPSSTPVGLIPSWAINHSFHYSFKSFNTFQTIVICFQVMIPSLSHLVNYA